jgi:hypothetical protein
MAGFGGDNLLDRRCWRHRDGSNEESNAEEFAVTFFTREGYRVHSSQASGRYFKNGTGYWRGHGHVGRFARRLGAE